MFGQYTRAHTLTDPLSTNIFSYTEREKLLDHTPQITITPRKSGSREDVVAGSHAVIQEIDHAGSLQSHTGLQHNIYIDGQTPIAIMDNHNHALGIWREVLRDTPHRPTLIHIDAHADLEHPTGHIPANPSEEELRNYVHAHTHIGSFIQPALEAGIIADCIQVRSSYALEHLKIETDTLYILDIDLDFWMTETSIPTYHLQLLRSMMISHRPLLLTIATSPYFLDQDRASSFIAQLKPHLQSSL